MHNTHQCYQHRTQGTGDDGGMIMHDDGGDDADSKEGGSVLYCIVLY